MQNKLITEQQMVDVFKKLLYGLVNNDDNNVTKDNLDFRLTKLKGIVDYLNKEIDKTTALDAYSRKIYIPVKAADLNNCCYDINVNIPKEGSKFISFGIYIPPMFSKIMAMEPVIKFTSLECRGNINELSVSFVEVSRPSMNGVKEYYYEIDMTEEAIPVIDKVVIDVHNYDGYTNIVTDIFKGETEGLVTVNRPKTKTIDIEIKAGFDDIPERDILLRSRTVRYSENITFGDYLLLENANNLDVTTRYHVEEQFQVSEVKSTIVDNKNKEMH